jgi:hypothetical protein
LKGEITNEEKKEIAEWMIENKKTQLTEFEIHEMLISKNKKEEIVFTFYNKIKNMLDRELIVENHCVENRIDFVLREEELFVHERTRSVEENKTKFWNRSRVCILISFICFFVIVMAIGFKILYFIFFKLFRYDNFKDTPTPSE